MSDGTRRRADVDGLAWDSRGLDVLFGAVLFVVALVPRVVVGVFWSAEPVWDGHYYDFGARRLAEGAGYSDELTLAGHLVWHPWCHYPVGYSAFLAVFYKLFGDGHGVAAVANALTGAALAVVTWALARHALSPGRARIAGLIVALHPGLILYAALVMSEPLAALLTLTAFWAAVASPPRRGLALGALLLGVAALVRPQALLCAPFLALVVARAPGGDRPGPRAILAAAALACAVTLLPVLPWTARNCRVMDGCALVSTNAGWNLAIGAFPRATGRFETLHSSDGCADVTGQVQQDRCWFDYGLAQIRAHPWHWLALVPAKLGFTFDHESFAVEYLHEARPELWPEPRRAMVRGATTLLHRLLLAGAALGCIAYPGRRSPRGARMQGALLVVAGAMVTLAFMADTPIFWPLALFVAVVPWLPLPGRPPAPPALLLPLALLGTTAVTHAVFFGEDRYHMVVTPVLALMAAAALRSPGAAGPGSARFAPMPRLLLLVASLTCVPIVACSSSSSNNDHADGGGSSSSGSSSGASDTDACVAYEPDADLTSPSVTFSTDVLPILERSCGIAGSTCHGTPDVATTQQRPFLGYFDGGTDASQVTTGLVGVPSNEDPQMNEVTASTPAQSFMMHKLDWDQCTLAAACAKGSTQYTDCGQGMPYSSPQLMQSQRDTIRRWIAQGATSQ